MIYSKLKFSINPKLYIDDDKNQYKIPLKTNKHVDNKLLWLRLALSMQQLCFSALQPSVLVRTVHVHT